VGTFVMKRSENRGFLRLSMKVLNCAPSDEHLGRDRRKIIIEHDHLGTFGKAEDFCGLRSGPVPKMLNSAGVARSPC
jgi:hypothetical protein